MRILVFGAHPDDCEFKAGGSAAIWAQAGHSVKFISVTDGRSGHHQIPPSDLAGIRRKEAANAAAILGIETDTLGFPDGALLPTLEAREAVIRAEREFKPDVVFAHRPNDYHPDHRYSSQLVQDAAYMVVVPHVCPDVPPLEHNPAVFYLGDHFTKPAPFSADATHPIDSVAETKARALACHASQLFEWLPWVDGSLDSVPSGDQERLQWVAEALARRDARVAQRHREALRRNLRTERAAQIKAFEVFEVCEYGGRLTPDQFETLFGHPPADS